MKKSEPIIVSFFELEKWEEKYLQDKLSKFKNLSLNFFSTPLNNSILEKIKNTNIVAIFIYSQIDKKTLNKLPNLKFITTMSTGFDHIDLGECKRKNIKVSNVPYYGENTVAEHTFALILALSRKISESIERVKKYDFILTDLRGFDLKDKILGLIGMGHIGQHVARMARGFEMRVMAFDPKKDMKLSRRFEVKYTSLKNLLATADIISLHAPYNKKTHHLINKENIKLIKKGAYLINTARGGLVETQALIMALDKKILAGAGLDVLEEECFIKEEKELLAKPFQKKCDLKTILQDHLLIQHPQVLVTPHNAFKSEEALKRILDTTVENIKAYLQGKSINLIS